MFKWENFLPVISQIIKNQGFSVVILLGGLGWLGYVNYVYRQEQVQERKEAIRERKESNLELQECWDEQISLLREDRMKLIEAINNNTHALDRIEAKLD